MEALVSNARSYFRSMPKNRLFLYLFLGVALIGGAVVGLSFIQKETFTTLFSGLSTEDASAIVARLKEQKVPYQLGMGGSAIYVPKEKVYDVRLLLASQNALPGAGGVGYELFDKTNYGMTEFMQNINYKRAIQGELARTINQMPEVKGSRVHIAVPEKTLFTDREKAVTASVFLKLKPGKVLAKEQIFGIVHLVAGSVEGLKPENVVIIDSGGRMLHKTGDPNSAVMLSGQQFELQQSVERKLEDSIQSMLNRFIPATKSVVRASVELNLRKVEKVEEEYVPNKSAVTAEKKSKERSQNQAGKAGGVPGVASNVPGAGAKKDQPQQQDGGSKTSLSEREDSQISYDVSKSVKKIVEPFGDVKKISLALVIDGKYEKVKGQKGEETRYSPRSQKELTDIKNLVARAVGLDEERGDKLEVINMPFEVEQYGDDKGLIDQAERKEMIFTFAKYGFYVIILLSIFLFLVRPVLAALKGGRGQATPLKRVTDVYIKEERPAIPEPVEDKAQTALVSALKDKAVVGAIIKEWVREGT